MKLSRKIRNIKNKAYHGVNGKQRKQFCIEYQKILSEVFTNINNNCMEEIAQEGKSLSCKKGCIYCCFQHIYINIAHGIVIVDYLYSHDEVLKNFLNNYGQWKDSARVICQELDNKWISLAKENNIGGILDLYKHPLVDSYYDLQIPCLFLINNECSIYSVRPICCATHYSANPCEWCSPTSKYDYPAISVMPSDEVINKIHQLNESYLAFNQSFYQLTMSSLVYNLLTKGLTNEIDDFKI